MSFTQKLKTLAEVLNDATQGLFDRALKQVKLGRMLSPVKVTFIVTAAAAVDITTAASKAGATIVSGLADLATVDVLPAIQIVKSLRVTASGTANSLGSYIAGDAAATILSPTGSTVVGVARLSDDGKTLTFPTTVTAFVLEYIPRSDVDLTSTYPLS